MSIWKGKHGPLLIAEIGGNHEGDFEYAKKLTELAIESDVDYIKYQIYTGDSLVNPIENPQRNKHFKKFELSREKYRQLAEMCQSSGIGFMASIWHPAFAEWVDDYPKIYKIGSGDFTALPVIKAFMEFKKPLLLSCGLSSMEEVEEIVAFVQQDPFYQNPDHLALLQCTSMYPIPYSESHLNVIKTFKETFNFPIGYSDHTEGSKALEIAVAMGAEILEFHFTDSREGKVFRDHKVSLTKDEVQLLITDIKNIQALQGNGIKRPLAIEGDHVVTFRRAVYLNKDIEKGTIITENDLVCLRPNHGLDARDYYKLIGKKSTKDLKKHEALDWSFFESEFTCRLCYSKSSRLVKRVHKRPVVEVNYNIPSQFYYREVRQCNHCKVYNNIHELIDLESFYDGSYNSAITSNPLKKRFERIINIPIGKSDNKLRAKRVVHFLKNEINDYSNIEVLDIGSGTCVFLFELKKELPNVHCIDPDKAAIKHAISTVGVKSAHEGSVFDFKPENLFDFISLNKVLEHVDEPLNFLKKSISFLKRNGILYIELPNGQEIEKNNQINQRAEFNVEHLTIFNKESLEFLITKSGMTMLKIENIIDPSGKETVYAFARK